MSYEKIKSLSFSKDFNLVNINSASNNVQPLYYHKWNIEKPGEKTHIQFIASIVKNVIEGTFQFNSVNNLFIYTIEKMLGNKDKRVYWDSPCDYKSYSYKTGFTDSKEEAAYNESLKSINNFYLDIANAFYNNKYLNEFRKAKKTYYILKNNNNSYLSSLGQKTFKYSNNINNAKKFNGLQKMKYKNHFSISQYNYSFIEYEKEVTCNEI